MMKPDFFFFLGSHSSVVNLEMFVVKQLCVAFVDPHVH